MHTLRINFPLLGPAYRRHGIDINHLEYLTHQAITANNVTTPNGFSNILASYFFSPFEGFGHLYQNWERRMHLVLANIYRDSVDEEGNFIHLYSQRLYEIMRSPEAIRFYGYIEVDLGGYEGSMITPNNITTDILVEGEVAYLNIRRFNHYNMDHDRDIIFAFYEEIAGYNHLIIDLQNNLGGFPSYFFDLIVSPNIAAALHSQSYEFFPAGRNNLIYADAIIADEIAANPEGISLYYSAAGFVSQNNMPYFNQEDLAMLHNVIVWHNRVYPAAQEKAFDGKLWVLVGPSTQSAAEVAAMFVSDTNFATIVGQPTAGIMGAISAYVLLPNSGIIVRYDLGYMTDAYGRSFEEFGVQPDYFTRPGMNALQTVLALINE